VIKNRTFQKKTIKQGEQMKQLNIVDLIALATVKPELFTKEHLELVLNVKKKIMDEMFKQLTKEGK